MLGHPARKRGPVLWADGLCIMDQAQGAMSPRTSIHRKVHWIQQWPDRTVLWAFTETTVLGHRSGDLSILKHAHVVQDGLLTRSL